MDYGHYAAVAVALANARLDTVDDVAALTAAGSGCDAIPQTRDLQLLVRVRRDLRQLFALAVAGDEQGAVALVNGLLERYPVTPRISGHDSLTWHLHVDDQTSAGRGVVAEALFGLLLVITELGVDRLGVCGAPDCEDVFIDTSPNRSRRFCGDRCATRTNVAAFRRRRRTTRAS